MRESFIRRICIIIIPAMIILAVGAALTAYIEIPVYISMSVELTVSLLASGLWLLACAVAFARPAKVKEREVDKKDAVKATAETAEVKPVASSIAPQPVACERSLDILVRDCRKAIENMSSFADNTASTNAAAALLKNVENSLSDIEAYEKRLRKAVAMCEDVTNEVYIMSVLANVEVGAHADSIAGFEVIAKQIQPLAETGSMAAIEAKASLDSAFSPIENIRSGIKNVYKEISADTRRGERLRTCLASAERSVERLSEEMGCEEK